jgi:hypothetical protein
VAVAELLVVLLRLALPIVVLEVLAELIHQAVVVLVAQEYV